MGVGTGERPNAVGQEMISCAWCGAKITPTGSALVSCPRCAAATTHPEPTDQELEEGYAGWYRPASGRFVAGGDHVLALSRARLARRLDRIAPPGPVLDVGAGDGSLLRAIRARGREALGLERGGASEGIIAQEIGNFDRRIGEWAAVVFWHTLEHLRYPGRAVDRARALLAPGGILVIAVPNIGSWQAHAFRERWFHLDLPRHLVHLTSGALIAGVRERDFEVERVSYWRGGQVLFGWLHGLVGGMPGHPDLYGAIRRPEAWDRELSSGQRLGALMAAAALSPAALALAAAEIAARSGGTVYLEARRA